MGAETGWNGGSKGGSGGSVSLLVSRGDTMDGDCGGPSVTGEGRIFLVSGSEGGGDAGFRVVDTGPEGGTEEAFELPFSDMTTLGTRLVEAARESRDEGEIGVCFDSLTDLLRHNGEEKSYVFLHLVMSHLREADAVGHVHLDSEEVGDGTVGVFETLFDETVRL